MKIGRNSTIKSKCYGCKKIAKLTGFRGKFYCWNCYRKRADIIGGNPMMFADPLTEQCTISFLMTKSQKESMLQRIKSIGVKKSVYIRELLLADLRGKKRK